MKITAKALSCMLILLPSSVALRQSNSAANSEIPLCPGLTIVTAVHQPAGDYESIKTIQSITPQNLRMRYSTEQMSSDWLESGPPTLKTTILYRTVLFSDLETARLYQQTFLDKSDETIPDTTAIGTSAAVLRALKTKGEAELGISNAYAGLKLGGNRDQSPNYYDYLISGTIKRVTAGVVRVPVLVNDRFVELPTIHAAGNFGGDESEFYFLDDEQNPLTLKFRLGIGAIKPITPEMAKACDDFRKAGADVAASSLFMECNQPPGGGDRDTLRVVKINYRCADVPNSLPGQAGKGPGQGIEGGRQLPIAVGALEEALLKTGKADVYSIYFSFNSDAIREESEPTLKEIGEILRKHPDWKLSVNGHTDSIASDKYNLALSQKRAAAAKDALVKRYGVNPARLVTSGLGESEPKDTNDTLEGRARNRRVELVRM
jgi:outer membrane protein OmpA-like peptidoglycan-associated protein